MSFLSTYPSWIPVDTRLTPLGNQVRVMTHLHGGFVAADSDGNPAVTPNGFGPGDTQTSFYTNQIAGDAGVAAVVPRSRARGDPAQCLRRARGRLHHARRVRYGHASPTPIGIPGGAYEIPLVIQDRQFNTDGTFRYPVSDIEGVKWIGEYFGDVMLVNGKVWPYLDVEPRMYRLRILNGCNARILNLDIGGPTLWQIGAEGGLFDVPVLVKSLVLAPAERADVLVDFSKFAGETLVMKNHKPHKPVSNPAPQLESVMQIRVGTKVNQSPAQRRFRRACPGRRADLPASGTTRYITLNEIDPEEVEWYAEPQRRALRRRPRDGDAEGRHGRRLGLRESHRRYAPDAHAPRHVPGGRPHAV